MDENDTEDLINEAAEKLSIEVTRIADSLAHTFCQSFLIEDEKTLDLLAVDIATRSAVRVLGKGVIRGKWNSLLVTINVDTRARGMFAAHTHFNYQEADPGHFCVDFD